MPLMGRRLVFPGFQVMEIVLDDGLVPAMVQGAQATLVVRPRRLGSRLDFAMLLRLRSSRTGMGSHVMVKSYVLLAVGTYGSAMWSNCWRIDISYIEATYFGITLF